VERLLAQPVFAAADELDDAALLRVLLQRRFVSLLFAPVYDIGIDGLRDSTALRLAREILREEYPDHSGGTPSHREELVSDLISLGATRQQVVAARPSAETTATIAETLTLALDLAAEPGDVAVLTLLRLWGEVLVAVEYGRLWSRMEPRFAQTGVASRFYRPHYDHDGHEPLADATADSRTHSGRLGWCLAQALADDAAVARFEQVGQRVLNIRLRFYGQFAG